LRYSFIYIIFFVFTLPFMLYGCSIETEEEALDNAFDIARSTFYSNEPVDANEQTAEFDFYLPAGLTIEEEAKNNIILSDGSEHYIVFYNDLESPTSKLNYQSAKDSKSLIYESFDDEDEFGYIQVVPGTDENYQIQAGIGGVKITTYATKNELEDTAEELMKIARSIIEENVIS